MSFFSISNFFEFFAAAIKKYINSIDMTSSSDYVGKDIRNYRDTRNSGEGGTLLAQSLPLQASHILGLGFSFVHPGQCKYRFFLFLLCGMNPICDPDCSYKQQKLGS